MGRSTRLQNARIRRRLVPAEFAWCDGCPQARDAGKTGSTVDICSSGTRATDRLRHLIDERRFQAALMRSGLPLGLRKHRVPFFGHDGWDGCAGACCCPRSVRRPSPRRPEPGAMAWINEGSPENSTRWRQCKSWLGFTQSSPQATDALVKCARHHVA